MEFIKRNPKIFILSGKARSGKEEVFKIIKNYYKNKDVVSISFAHYIKDYAKLISGWDGGDETKPRDLLQQLGIELIKNKIDNKMFINRVLEDIAVLSYFFDIIVITDARLLSEMEAIKESYPNSISIRIKREEYDSGLTREQKNHLTEIDLDNYDKFDYQVINNDYDILVEEIKKILQEVEHE